MKTNTILVLVVVLLVIVVGVYLATRSTLPEEETPLVEESGQTWDVDIVGMAFSPAELTIKVGDTVIWTNRDNVPHGVLSDIGQAELQAAPFYKDATYSHTFNTSGTFNYHCGMHPLERGTVTVTE